MVNLAKTIILHSIALGWGATHQEDLSMTSQHSFFLTSKDTRSSFAHVSFGMNK
jgi:hypothetical protein